MERERVNVRSEPDFYWRNSPVNFKGENPGGKSFFPTFPSGGYAHENVHPTARQPPGLFLLTTYDFSRACTVID